MLSGVQQDFEGGGSAYESPEPLDVSQGIQTVGETGSFFRLIDEYGLDARAQPRYLKFVDPFDTSAAARIDGSVDFRITPVFRNADGISVGLVPEGGDDIHTAGPDLGLSGVLLINVDAYDNWQFPNDIEPGRNHVDVQYGSSTASNGYAGWLTSVTPSFNMSDSQWHTLSYSLARVGTVASLDIWVSNAANENQLIIDDLLVPNFDFDTTYRLQIAAHSGAEWSIHDIDNIELEVNHQPSGLELSASTVAENSPEGTAIGSFSSTDSDADDAFTYSLVAGEGSEDNAAFTISGDELRTATSFDFETKSSYSIRVRTTDATGLMFEKAFSIGVSDVNEAPTAVALSNGVVVEGTSPASPIGRFTAEDPDADDAITFALVPGDEPLDNSAFTLVDGVLYAKTAFDFDTQSLYRVRVRATDSEGLWLEKTFVITVQRAQVGDAFLVFYVDTGELRLNPGNAGAAGSDGRGLGISSFGIQPASSLQLTTDATAYSYPSGTYSLFPPDRGGFNTVGAAFYELTTPNISENVGYFNHQNMVVSDAVAGFSQDITWGPGNGGVVVSTLSGTGYEGTPEWSFGMIGPTDLTEEEALAAFGVVDQGSIAVGQFQYGIRGVLGVQYFRVFATRSVLPPVVEVELSSTTVAENLSPGTVVGRLSSSVEGLPRDVTYQLVAGVGGDGNEFFTIEGDELRTATSFDFETKSSYSIRVRTTDAAGLTFEKAFSIGVSDVNESPTAITLSPTVRTLPENASTVERRPVAQVVIVDDAIGENTLSLEGVDAGLFELDGNRLFLREGVALDYGVQATYDVTVRVVDASAVDHRTETPLTLRYDPADGRLQLQNNLAESIDIQSVGLLSPSQSLLGSEAVVPESTIVTLNTNASGVFGLHSEIFFANFGTPALTLEAGGSWDFGAVLEPGLGSADLMAVFATDPDADPESTAAAGSFLYSLLNEGAGGPTVRGSIIRDVVAGFSLNLVNVPEHSGREYMEPGEGQEIVETEPRTDARQIILRGNGRLILDAANTHTGGVLVESGELVIRNPAAIGSGRLNVRAGGRVTIDAGSTRVDVPALSISEGGVLEIGTGGITIAAGGYDPIELRELLKTGRGAGGWDGPAGIRTMDAAAGSFRAVGYRILQDGSAVVGWGGFGDTNLDGRVNSSDVSMILAAGRFGTAAVDSGWWQGDFNYDGRVSSQDINLMLAAGLINAGSYWPEAAVTGGNATVASSRATAATGMSVFAIPTGPSGEGEEVPEPAPAERLTDAASAAVAAAPLRVSERIRQLWESQGEAQGRSWPTVERIDPAAAAAIVAPRNRIAALAWTAIGEEADSEERDGRFLGG